MIEIVNCLLGKRESHQYSTIIRSFAITLHSLSPRAYNYIRVKFRLNLPHASTIRKWFQHSNSCEPGINTEVLLAISDLVNDARSQGKELYCSISFDEMAIRRHISWLNSEKRFSGLITYGDKMNSGLLQPVAKNVLVFLVTCLSNNLSLPVAYYGIVQPTGKEKEDMIKQVLREVIAVGATVLNLSFDGIATNRNAMENLGVSFDVQNPKTFFFFNEQKIQCIVDNCHVLKLLRNALSVYKKFKDPDGNWINWSYLEKLEKLRVKDNLVTHKVTKKHIDAQKRNPMNVLLAVQLFSHRVASSLDFLQKSGEAGFRNCSGTAKFAQTMNDLFDVFNTKTINTSNDFKSAITRENGSRIFKFLDEASDYISKISYQRKPITKSRRHFGFTSLIFNIESAKELFKDYVEKRKIPFLPMFPLMQDKLETLFSRVCI